MAHCRNHSTCAPYLAENLVVGHFSKITSRRMDPAKGELFITGIPMTTP